MLCYHLSPIYNRKTILKFGICPSHVNLKQHLTAFRQEGWLDDQEDKMIYTILENDKMGKYLRDSVYGKIWINPRNKIVEFPGWWDQVRDKPYLNLYEHTSMIFDIYEIKNIHALNNHSTLHIQRPGEPQRGTCYNMDPKYAHDDKPLIFSKTPEKEIRIIKQAQYDYDKHGVSIKILPTVRY